MDHLPDTPSAAPFRVTFVTGVTPDKWANTWRRRSPTPLEMVPVDETDQLTALRAGEADMAFVRLPVDRAGLHVIPLYRETPVAVVSREHPVAAYDEIPLDDLADEHLLQPPDDVPAWRDLATEVRDGSRHPVPEMTLRQAIESVAAQAGIVIVPRSVARVHHRKDVVAVPVTGLAESQVGLAWPERAEDPRVETFIGIVRGRTERSSRGDAGGQSGTKADTKPAATKAASGPRPVRAPRPGRTARGRRRR